MVRVKIPILKIENKAKRRVTFSKRRKGLFSKAEELCSQSNSRIAIVVFSGNGKMFTFGEPDSLLEECGLNGSPFASTSTYQEQQPRPLKQIPLDKQPQILLAKQPKRKESRKGKEKVCEIEALPSGSSSNNSSIVTGCYAEPSQYGSGCSSYNFSTGCGFADPNGYNSSPMMNFPTGDANGCYSNGYNSSPMMNFPTGDANGCYSSESMMCYDHTPNEDFFNFTDDQVFRAVFKQTEVISNSNQEQVCGQDMILNSNQPQLFQSGSEFADHLNGQDGSGCSSYNSSPMVCFPTGNSYGHFYVQDGSQCSSYNSSPVNFPTDKANDYYSMVCYDSTTNASSMASSDEQLQEEDDYWDYSNLFSYSLPPQFNS